MKKSLIPFAAFAALMFTSCSTSPVDKMHDILDTFEDEIEDAETAEEIHAAQLKMAIDLNNYIKDNKEEIEKIGNDDKEAIEFQERMKKLDAILKEKKKELEDKE